MASKYLVIESHVVAGRRPAHGTGRPRSLCVPDGGHARLVQLPGDPKHVTVRSWTPRTSTEPDVRRLLGRPDPPRQGYDIANGSKLPAWIGEASQGKPPFTADEFNFW